MNVIEMRRKLAEVCDVRLKTVEHYLGTLQSQHYEKDGEWFCWKEDWLPDQNWNHCGMVIEAMAYQPVDVQTRFALECDGMVVPCLTPSKISRAAYAAVSGHD